MKYKPEIVKAYYKQCGLPEPVFEYRFHKTRLWRIDIAFIKQKVAVEVQGGVFVRGRHSRGAAMLKEWDKLNTLAAMGWRVLYCQPVDVCMNDFVQKVKSAVLSGETRKDG